jgi:hypothetical protein
VAGDLGPVYRMLFFGQSRWSVVFDVADGKPKTADKPPFAGKERIQRIDFTVDSDGAKASVGELHQVVLDPAPPAPEKQQGAVTPPRPVPSHGRRSQPPGEVLQVPQILGQGAFRIAEQVLAFSRWPPLEYTIYWETMNIHFNGKLVFT